MSASTNTAARIPYCQRNLASSVFYHTRDGVMIIALNGSILAVNHAFTTITGYTEDDVLGKTSRMLKSERQGPAFYRAMWDAVRKRGFWQGETWNRRKDGSHIAEDITVTMVPGDNGEPSHYIAVFKDVTAVREVRQQLEIRSRHDPLTALPNRLFMAERLEGAIGFARNDGSELALAFIDLDGFKEVNDQLGHATGDVVLVQVATNLSAALRKSDTLARLGGDEFVAILPGLRNDADLPLLMGRMLDACSTPIILDEATASVSASIGVAFMTSALETPEELLNVADAAMYQAKRDGRNTYRVFTIEPSLSTAR